MTDHDDPAMWPDDSAKSPCARAVAAWVGIVLLTAVAFWLCVGFA